MKNRSFLRLCNQSTYRNYGRTEITLITRAISNNEKVIGRTISSKKKKKNFDFELNIKFFPFSSYKSNFGEDILRYILFFI